MKFLGSSEGQSTAQIRGFKRILFCAIVSYIDKVIINKIFY